MMESGEMAMAPEGMEEEMAPEMMEEMAME